MDAFNRAIAGGFIGLFGFLVLFGAVIFTHGDLELPEHEASGFLMMLVGFCVLLCVAVGYACARWGRF